MGYESRIYVVDCHKRTGYAEVIAVMNMCKMGYGGTWTDLFKTDFPYEAYHEDGNTKIEEDAYGECVKCSDIVPVIEWLEREIEGGNDYRRLPILLSLLKSFEKDKWAELKVVHYGY